MVKTSISGADGYSDAIDFANACREFYMNRKKLTEDFKEQMGMHEGGDQTAISNAMDRLRQEMASLMDLDLNLMEQLLTLNETIEEIKFQRLHGGDKSLPSSCCTSRDDWTRLTDVTGSRLKMRSTQEVDLIEDKYLEITRSSETRTPVQRRTVNRTISLPKMKLGQWSLDSGYGEENTENSLLEPKVS